MTQRILMLHKLKGYVVTRPKASGREKDRREITVYSLLPPEFHGQGWVPVGRLDKDSTGLLLFVQEGPLVYRLQTPGHIDKTYEVWVKGRLRREHLEKVLEGVETPIGLLKAKLVEVLGVVGPNTLLKVTLDEGKNRHIRRLFGALKDAQLQKSFKTLDLTRVAIGPVHLDMEPGQWRFLTNAETSSILVSAQGKARAKTLQNKGEVSVP